MSESNLHYPYPCTTHNPPLPIPLHYFARVRSGFEELWWPWGSGTRAWSRVRRL